MFGDVLIHAWIAAALVAAVAGVIGFFVVARGAAFAAHALPLSAFPGAAAAHLAGVDPFYGLLAFSGLAAVGVNQLARRARRDVATAMTLTMLLGLGALLTSRASAYFQSIYGLLFGEPFAVSRADLPPLAAVAVAAVALVLVFFRPLLLASVSPDLAQARGVSAPAMDLLFLAVLALVTAICLPVVGALLTFSLMVGPASAARAFAVGPGCAVAISAVLGVVMVTLALALAYMTDWPVGFFVGGLSAAAYGAGRIAGFRSHRAGLEISRRIA